MWNAIGQGEQGDIDRLVEAIRRVQRIMAAPPLAAHSPSLLYAKTLAKQFGENTDRYWREYIARTGHVAYNPAGTCKMGKAEDPTAVVDPELRVIGEQTQHATATTNVPLVARRPGNSC